MMGESLAPPDVEVAVVSALSGVAGRVATEYADHPDGSVRVSATGGGAPVDRVVVAPTVLVECWHEDETAAWNVARTAWARLVDAAGGTHAGVEFKHVSADLPTNYPDVNRMSMHRFQFVVTVHSRIVEVTL